MIKHALSVSPAYDDEILRSFADKVWVCHRYLQGSTTKEAPYEIEYCMRHAIGDWLKAKCIVTTALTDEKDFHLKPGDPWEYVATAMDRYKEPIPEEKLIFIGVPRIYKHMPLFCAALYHELGHFVDLARDVAGTTLLSHPAEGATDKMIEVILSHRREHFADLFAACYAGPAIIDTLYAINPDAGISLSHPATADRIEVVRGFLEGEEFDELTMFQEALASLGLPPLKRRYSIPSIASAFDDIRPYRLSTTEELHGMMAAGWSYLGQIKAGAGPSWAATGSQLEAVRIVNDLTEKTIRNASIRYLWERALT
ncbi:hypothetical protein [Sinorhizobium saheli]|uniref:Uncharacterized protein n=1 Tax=Sinorhizobium saheli TaxID=36856 RepID=A0A178YTK8_SINSA|nr:hypothetical protein [Sinorhizobium saheli]MQW90703.1 hypothetical protein [Sinorhizobium saheli]OAP50085.1 hypothetical protein ATB98_12330 [Sinorhizobium saheli]